MTKKNSERERALIISGNKRPYGAKIVFQILNSYNIGQLENATILLDSGAFATIEPDRSESWEGSCKFLVKLVGFPTASSAELAGLRFAQALIFSAISLDFGLRLIYRTQEPAVVYERFRSEGFAVCSQSVTTWPDSVVIKEITEAYRGDLFERRLLLSMELYSAARLELNERTRFITMVSALEPLAEQQNLSPVVESYVNDCIALLNQSTAIEEGLRNSLLGRVKQLKQESVRQALNRLATSYFPGKDDIRKQLDYSYGLRSKLLHEGVLSDRDIDLANETVKISRVLRSLYEIAVKRPLHAKSVV